MNTPMCVGKTQSKVPPHCPNHGRQGMMGNGFQGDLNDWHITIKITAVKNIFL